MLNQKRIRDYGIKVGAMEPGDLNSITDIEGVRVGHVTICDGDAQTGVTAILPHQGNIYQQKLLAATHIINGFGKSMGLMQIDEMGVIETPILLSNTLSIGVASDALIEYMLEHNNDIGTTTGTVNPLVFECNDSYLNDIRAAHVTKENIFEALNSTEQTFSEGAVGAGRGMSCYKLKGGIGTASRRFMIDESEGLLGALVMTNMGQKHDFIIDGKNIGKAISLVDGEDPKPDTGSIIIILATDVALSERQLKRVAKRATVGLSRTGSFIGSGSGEVVLAFTTKNSVSHYKSEEIENISRTHEDDLDTLFRAAAESVEEAILNSMISAESITGVNGNTRKSLQEYMQLLKP